MKNYFHSLIQQTGIQISSPANLVMPEKTIPAGKSAATQETRMASTPEVLTEGVIPAPAALSSETSIDLFSSTSLPSSPPAFSGEKASPVALHLTSFDSIPEQPLTAFSEGTSRRANDSLPRESQELNPNHDASAPGPRPSLPTSGRSRPDLSAEGQIQNSTLPQLDSADSIPETLVIDSSTAYHYPTLLEPLPPKPSLAAELLSQTPDAGEKQKDQNGPGASLADQVNSTQPQHNFLSEPPQSKLAQPAAAPQALPENKRSDPSAAETRATSATPANYYLSDVLAWVQGQSPREAPAESKPRGKDELGLATHPMPFSTDRKGELAPKITEQDFYLSIGNIQLTLEETSPPLLQPKPGHPVESRSRSAKEDFLKWRRHYLRMR